MWIDALIIIMLHCKKKKKKKPFSYLSFLLFLFLFHFDCMATPTTTGLTYLVAWRDVHSREWLHIMKYCRLIYLHSVYSVTLVSCFNQLLLHTHNGGVVGTERWFSFTEKVWIFVLLSFLCKSHTLIWFESCLIYFWTTT